MTTTPRVVTVPIPLTDGTTVHLSGEAGIHPALAITPTFDVHDGWTGAWDVRHVPTGRRLLPSQHMPVEHLRVAAEHLAASDVDWHADPLPPTRDVAKAALNAARKAWRADDPHMGMTLTEYQLWGVGA